MSESFKIESLFAARLFVSPQLAGERIFFLSDLSGRISLYAMDKGGSVPEPLLSPDIALQNPALLGGYSFAVFPKLGKIVVMIDHDGDENYHPYLIPLEGGLPEPLLGDRFVGKQVHILDVEREHNQLVFHVDYRTAPDQESVLVNLETLEVTSFGTSIYGNYLAAHSEDYAEVVLVDSYTQGDALFYTWDAAAQTRKVLYGKPLEERAEGEAVTLSGFQASYMLASGKGMLLTTVLFDDCWNLGYLSFDAPDKVLDVVVEGLVHEGSGVLENLEHLVENRYLLTYNIDGVSWVYEGHFDVFLLRFTVDRVLVGQGVLSNGVLQSLYYEKDSDNYVLAFSTAVSPAQIYTLEGQGATKSLTCHTRERILGIPQAYLAQGEDASFDSHDGLRVSARLYMPAPELSYTDKRPVVFYVHGGPQSQERPDFTWFSMALIQFFTLNGFAVFVPNVRGSEGYGMDYVKRVDHDWGGQDRLDHVAAFEHLKQDVRLDLSRAGVMGRSYGGYMTLMQVGLHPDLWTAACDMFGPYNLFTFIDRLPETWKTYFYLAIGHPEKDGDFLKERSPSSYLHNLACPMLVIQGRNDPRVVAQESEELVAKLRDEGKDVELLMMENEGHDVLKYENKVWIFNAIVDFFKKHLRP